MNCIVIKGLLVFSESECFRRSASSEHLGGW
jgi:hypothetical protein